jgi:ribonuclease HI
MGGPRSFSRVITAATPSLLMPYTRVGGCVVFPPPLLAIVQTDGSFGGRKNGGSGRVAAILTGADGTTTQRYLAQARVKNSHEAEWASVAAGLRLALENNEVAVGLENDCLGVIAALSHHGPDSPRLRHEYAREWRAEILRMAAETAWTGVRWIPRAANRADDLFSVRQTE